MSGATALVVLGVVIVALSAALLPLLVVDLVSVGTSYQRRAHAWLLGDALALAVALVALVGVVAWL